MKFLLLMLLFLGIPYVVYAHGQVEPTYPPDCWVQPSNSGLWYPCGTEDAKLAQCVSLMELAMKAVDPFVNDPTLDVSMDEVLRIKKVWERAKNSCWKELKDLQPQHYH